jgi:hypothetical protein
MPASVVYLAQVPECLQCCQLSIIIIGYSKQLQQPQDLPGLQSPSPAAIFGLHCAHWS